MYICIYRLINWTYYHDIIIEPLILYVSAYVYTVRVRVTSSREQGAKSYVYWSIANSQK